jgi:hypothetical protein
VGGSEDRLANLETETVEALEFTNSNMKMGSYCGKAIYYPSLRMYRTEPGRTSEHVDGVL